MNRLLELRRKKRHPFFFGLPHVHDADVRHLLIVHAFRQFEQGEFAALAIVKLSSEGVAEPSTTTAFSIWPRIIATSRA